MSGETRLSLLVDLNATRAKAEAAGLKTEVEKLGRSAREAGQGAGAGAAGLEQLETAAKGAAGGAATAAHAHGQLAADLAKLSPTMLAVANVHNLAEQAARANASAIASLVASQAGLDDTTRAAMSAELAHAAALDGLKAKYVPLFAAQRAYEQGLLEIAEAERLGALTANEAAAARSRLAASLPPLSSGLQGLNKATAASAQSAGMMAAQWNDVVMMTLAGQNPMQLAIQQGTQMTQAFGNAGAGGALRMLGAGFISMLNPMNLVTMGAIALGAVVVQALMSMGGEVKTVDEALSDLKTTVGEFSTEAGRGVQELTRDFGTLDGQIVRLQENLTLMGQIQAQQDLKASLQSLTAATQPKLFSSADANVAVLAGRPQTNGLFEPSSDDGFFERRRGLREALDGLENADGAAAQKAAIQDLAAKILDAAGGIEQMNDGQSAFYLQLLETERVIDRIVALEARAARQRVEMARETGTENARMGGPSSFDKADPTAALEANVRAAQARQSAAAAIAAAEQENDLARARLTYGEQSYELRALEANQAREATEAEIRRLGIAMQGVEASRMRAATEDAIALAEQSRQAASSAAAAKMRGDLEDEARIVQLTAQYGAQSLEVAYARAAAEREVYAATLAAQDISGAAADELMRAWDAARGIAAVNMAAGIGAAASEAIFLAEMLGVSLDHALALEGLKKGGGNGPTPRAQPFTFGGAGGLGDGFTGGKGLGFGDLNRPASYDTPSTGSSGTGGGSGGGKAAGTSVADLIAKYEAENDILRTLDPIQKIVAQNHLALADATEEQRDKLVEVIAQNQRLTEVQERVQQIGQIGKNAFTGLATGALSFRSALGNVLDGLAQMAASSAWDLLWSGGGKKSGGGLGGLLSSFFGGGGGAPGAKTKAGGGLGSVLTSIIGRADGGPITGQGGPREDNILIRASSGEYMVNAAATAANLPLVEAINAGAGPRQLAAILGAMVSQPSLPAFADGGRIGGSAPSGWMRAASVSQATAAPAATGGEMAVTVNVEGARGNAEIADMVERGVRSGIAAFSRSVLPARMRQINADPRRMS